MVKQEEQVFEAGQDLTAGQATLFRARIAQGLDPLTGKPKKAPAARTKKAAGED